MSLWKSSTARAPGLSARSGPQNGEFNFRIALPCHDRFSRLSMKVTSLPPKRFTQSQHAGFLCLGVLTPPVVVAGDYTLTFIADGVCATALPADSAHAPTR